MDRIIENEPLFRYSTFGVGGNADYFYKLKNAEDLPGLITFAKEKNLPYIFLGGGSNVLFSDKGFRGLVIKNELKNIKVEGEKILAESGVTIASLLKTAIENSLTGLEPWSGLPGTVGGAVRGNAGCNGLETADILLEATVFDENSGKIETVTKDYFEYSYRKSSIKKSPKIVLAATFQLRERGFSPEKQQQTIMDINRQRIEKQPFGLTCGSFFKNPSPDKPAGMLIDQAGLKGKKIGNAQISEKHGNFFLNLGGATAQDILELAKLARTHVEAKFGFKLQEEIQIYSETGPDKLDSCLLR